MMSAWLLPASFGSFSGFVGRLNPLDWAIVIVLLAGTVMAFMRGLVRSVIGLLGVGLGIVLAAWYAPQAAARLARWITQPVAAQVIAFIGILSLVYLLAVLIGRVLRGACKAVGLGLLDRLGGAAFGFVRAVLVISAVMVPAAPFLPLLPFARTSVLLPYLRTAAHGVSFVMPRDFEDRLSAGAKLLGGPEMGHRRRPASYPSNSTAGQRTIEGDAQ